MTSSTPSLFSGLHGKNFNLKTIQDTDQAAGWARTEKDRPTVALADDKETLHLERHKQTH